MPSYFLPLNNALKLCAMKIAVLSTTQYIILILVAIIFFETCVVAF